MTPAMTLAARPIGGRSYVLHEQKVMFVSVAKNACTSIKWLLADLSGQDPARFHDTFAMVSDPADTIHQRQLWQGIGKYDVDAQRAEIHPDNGWFVFGVVREPRARLFSAWQSKFLNHDPWYARYAEESFYPALPTSTADVVEGFARFVRFLAANPGHPLATRDTHFAAQSALLQSWRVNYSRIYDVGEVGELVGDLRAHLARSGHDRPLQLARDNSTPLKAHRLLFADGIGELVDERYAVDLEEFGDRWDPGAIPDTEPLWTPEVFRAIAATASAYDEIRYLTRARRRLHDRLEQAEERIAALEGSGAPLSGRTVARELAVRLRRRVLPG
jgi:hypothetical protein